MNSAIPFSDPNRTQSAFRPMKALHHFRKLVADKEDTEQVFHIIRALSGKTFVKRAQQFWASDMGTTLLAEPQNLVGILDDHATLRKLPMGTVGQAYCDFMEQEGLTAQGLVDEYEKFADRGERFNDLLELYGNRQRDTHDLFHVLTGYGRDALGEQCVLAFTYSQNPNAGILFIAYAGGREIKRGMKDVPIYSAIREAQNNGKAALKIAHQDIRALLAEPLAAARKRIGIGEPTLYNRAHEIMRSGGVDPYDLMGQKKAAA
jgi:ubiquinone biosynthesis protein COQ4